MKGADRPLEALEAGREAEEERQVLEYLATIPADEQKALKDCYSKGEQMPSGYVDAHDWANAQLLHGLRQSLCAKGCRRWLFPQEVPDHVCPAPRKPRSASRGEKP